jgi:hypothetical protein
MLCLHGRHHGSLDSNKISKHIYVSESTHVDGFLDEFCIQRASPLKKPRQTSAVMSLSGDLSDMKSNYMLQQHLQDSRLTEEIKQHL